MRCSREAARAALPRRGPRTLKFDRIFPRRIVVIQRNRPREARRCTTAKTAGRMKSVATVAAASPPITARPSGAVCSPPSPVPKAIGTMPASMAQLVIRMGRNRLVLAKMAAACGSDPCIRACSANVSNKIALATATPTAMIAPMND